MSSAEFLLEYAVEEALKKVGSIVLDEFARIWGLKKDLKTLGKRVQSIQSLLQQVDKQATDADLVNPWLARLQDQVYDADDVLDEFSYEVLRRKIEIGDQLKRKIRSYLVCGYNPILFRRQIANKVKKINESLAEIEKQAISDFQLRNAVGAGRGDVAIKPDQIGSHSMLDESKPPVGRKEELEKINNFLEAKSFLHDLKFVCIVGFGGLGKTTLAKMVSDQAKKNNRFDVTTWIDISKTSNATQILGDILQKVDPSLAVSNNIDTILEKLRKKLEKKTFLLVLDNVWNEEDTDWLNLEECLSLISKRDGNSIIMTTRSTELARVMTTSCRCLVELQELSDDECWSIIKGKTFGKGEDLLEDEGLLRIGVDIAKKCRGVPLVANVVGGMLRSKRDTNYWAFLAKSNVWEDVKKNNILPVLKLSFDRLPSPLKQCFAYCSLLPKNSVFRKEQLIQLWMAEGFLHTTLENASTSESSTEDIGDQYFAELCANSFFQNVEVDKWGNILRCNMHDLIHDLAMSVSSEHQQDGSSNQTFQTHDRRRMSFFVNDGEDPGVESYGRDELRKLRSLHSNRAVFLNWSDFESLRCLNLKGADYNELSTAIGELKHLRYLDISKNSSIQKLPESITKLYNLQTLRVVKCLSLKELPSDIGILVSLRYIYFDYDHLVPFKVGSLINLRTLPLFVVKQMVGYEIHELKPLNELRGKLEIRDLRHVRNGNEALAANLKGKKLSKLRLKWQSDAESDDEREGSMRCSSSNHREVLEGLVPPGSILSLRIEGYMGKLFPEWISSNGGCESTLNRLTKLKLFGCMKCEILPTLGHLPSLKILEIKGMENVRRIGSEFYGEGNGNVKLFQVLEKLKLCNMNSLEEWEAPTDINSAFPTLQELDVYSCSLLKSIPSSHLHSLKRIFIYSCSKLVSLLIGSTSLEKLEIYECEELESISSSQDLVSLKLMWILGCPILTCFPHRGLLSLEELQIVDCEKVEFDSSPQDLPSLKILKIESSLRLISHPLGLKSLQDLTIRDFSDLSADAFRGLSSLKHLHLFSLNVEFMPNVEDLISLETLNIYRCRNLTSLPEGLHSLKCLQKLEINGCDKITSLSSEIKHCTSLKRLLVLECKGLISIETDIISSLSQLEALYLGSFSNELVEFPGFDESRAVNNPSLAVLVLYGSDKIKSLPYLGNLTALKTLEIYYFGISELPIWLGKLSSLENVDIRGCESLISLPQSMQQLSKLTALHITECPLLAEKFKEDRGTVWPNISHIAYIEMDFIPNQDMRSRRNP